MAKIVSNVARLVALCLLLATAANATAINIGRVTRFLGNGSTSGQREGTGFGPTGALLFRPSGCTFDAAGNFYFADTNNYAVRRVPAGQRSTSTWLGMLGTVGDSPGSNGSAVRFGSPVSMRFTPDGSAGYITDFALNKIWKVVPSTTQVTLFAGNTLSAAGNADGTGTSAFFNQPADFLIRPSNLDMYVVENDGNRVRKVTSAAAVSLFAGSNTALPGFVDGAVGAARFNKPYGIAVHETANRYFVSDQLNKVIREISAAGVVSTVAGNGTSGNADGIGRNAFFVEPWGLAMDRTNTFLYIADKGNNAIRRMDVQTFQVDRVVGNLNSNWTAGANSVLAQISAPTAICFLTSSTAQRMYITGDHSISYVSTRRTRSVTMTVHMVNGTTATPTLSPNATTTVSPNSTTTSSSSSTPAPGSGGSTPSPNGTDISAARSPVSMMPVALTALVAVAIAFVA